MSDLISRKAAIETLHKLRVEQARKWNYSFRSLDEGRMEGAELAISIIENLGAAEPAIDGDRQISLKAVLEALDEECDVVERWYSDDETQQAQYGGVRDGIVRAIETVTLLVAEPASAPAPAETMTTYTRRDGEPIGDEYGWVTSLEWFEDDDYATELIKETWTKTGSEIIFVNADKIVCTECGANKSQGCDCGAALNKKGKE